MAFLLAIAILPIGAVGIGEAIRTAEETSRLAKLELINRTRLAAEEGRVTLTAAFGALEGLAPGLDPRRSDSCSRLLSTFVGSDPRYLFAALVRPDGTVACTSGPDGARPAFLDRLDIWSPQEAPRTAVQLSAYEPELDAVVLNAYRSVYREGQHSGTLILSLPVTLIQTLSRATENDADFHLALLDWHGNVFAEGARNLGDPDWAPDRLEIERPGALSERVFTNASLTGEERSYALVPMFSGDVHALGSWSRRNLEDAATERLWLAVLFPSTMGVLAFAVAFFAVHRLAVRHVIHLRRVMGAFEIGRRGVRAHRLRDAAPEIADLGGAFDRMAETIERDEQNLQRAVEEKTALIREVYHRVKNNLQVVISMTNLQMRQARSEGERAALARLRERLMGLAAVHQRLYLANDLTRVRCDDLLGEIVATLARPSEGSRAPDVESSLAPLTLGPDQAIPLALLATEMVTNALKHGSTREGATIRVALEVGHDDTVRFGVSNTLARKRSGSRPAAALDSGVGAQLMHGFARQLGGSLEARESGGLYHVSLSFPVHRAP